MRTEIGQIFSTHPKDQNFTSVYQETFSKTGRPLDLFAVIEIVAKTPETLKLYQAELEKVFQTLVTTLKKIHVSSPIVSEDTFEKAIATINTALSRLVSHAKIDWLSNLHVALGAVFERRFFLSTTGNAQVYLFRKGNFTLLSEGLFEPKSSPVKLFANYSSGKLLAGDRVILSTNQLFNYLSLERLQEFLQEETIADSCKEIIGAVSEIKNIGFAAFLFEIQTSPAPLEPEKVALELALTSSQKSREFSSSLAWFIREATGFLLLFLQGVLRLLWRFLKSLKILLGRLFRKSAKARNLTYPRGDGRKSFPWAIGAGVVVLFFGIGFSVWQKASNEKKEKKASILKETENLLDEAEAAFIYNDEEQILKLLASAQPLLQKLEESKLPGDQAMVLQERWQELKNKLTKEIFIENPKLLTTFPNIPTDLIRSPEGFLGFNRQTQTLAFYDFRSGETKTVLADQNTSPLLLGGFGEASKGFLFLTKNAKLAIINLLENQLTLLDTEPDFLTNPNLTKIQTLEIFGNEESERIYLLDIGQNQIWRARQAAEEQKFLPAEAWLKTREEAPSLAEAVDMAVDGNIYILFPQRLEKYFNGQKQNFSLSPVSPELKKSQRITTAPDYQFLYLLEPENQRILIYNKSGKFQKQLKSAQFRDGSDLYVDEKNKLLYILSGQELLQVNF